MVRLSLRGGHKVVHLQLAHLLKAWLQGSLGKRMDVSDLQNQLLMSRVMKQDVGRVLFLAAQQYARLNYST